ncbi:MAG: DUF4231 domain-containing protein [Anaerolineae bacterium]
MMSAAPTGAPGAGAPDTKTVSTQGKQNYRSRWPAWAKQLPRLQFDKAANPEFQLLDKTRLDALLAGADSDAARRLRDDIEFLDTELLRLFRERDYEASLHQNRYRLVQISFMLLAALATIIGALQGLSMGSRADAVPAFALAETLVALFTTYLATISGRVPSLPLWLQNRRRAEYMRREYYRYLMRMSPYDNDSVKDYERKLLLSTRAANINRGIYPEQTNSSGQA